MAINDGSFTARQASFPLLCRKTPVICRNRYHGINYVYYYTPWPPPATVFAFLVINLMHLG